MEEHYKRNSIRVTFSLITKLNVMKGKGQIIFRKNPPEHTFIRCALLMKREKQQQHGGEQYNKKTRSIHKREADYWRASEFCKTIRKVSLLASLFTHLTKLSNYFYPTEDKNVWLYRCFILFRTR